MNLKSIPLKKWLEFAFTFVIGLLTLLALCFPLQQVTIGGLLTFQENAFDMFDFNSIFMSADFEWGSTVLGVIGIVQLVVSIILIIVSILNFINKRDSLVSKVIIGICIFFCLVYLIEGPLLNALYNKYGTYIDGYGVISGEVVSVTTLSYLPFILAVIFLVAYLCIDKYVVSGGAVSENDSIKITKKQDLNADTISNQNNGKIDKNDEEGKEIIPNEDNDIVSQLKTYKELLDSGILTQEEFDKLKKEILENNR